MGLIGFIFLHSFNFDYTLSEVVIDRVLNYEPELGKIFQGCGRKEDIEGARLAVNVYWAMLLNYG